MINITFSTVAQQEQLALTEYNRALDLLNTGGKDEALHIFQDLLETELLDQVEKPEVQDGRIRPMLSLKYSCYRNMAVIQSEMGDVEEAINSYWEASNLDDTDVMLWYRLGKLATKTFKLELACFAFKQGLKRVPGHWLCLDNIITVLYAVPDYMSCLIYISLALERDPTYIKGLAFRDSIFSNIPCLVDSYKVYNSKWESDPLMDVKYDRAIGDKFLNEAEELSNGWVESCKVEFKPKPLPDLTLRKPLAKYSWLELGTSLIDMHDHMLENGLNFVSRINLPTPASVSEDTKSCTPERKTDDCSDVVMDFAEKVDDDTHESFDDSQMVTDQSENLAEMDVDEDRKSSSDDIQIIEDEEMDLEGHQVEDKALEKDVEIKENGKTEKAKESGESEKDSEKCEKPDEKNEDKATKSDEKSSEKSEGKEDGQKVKKRRRSSLCFLQQWAWSSLSTRKSTRVKSGRKDTDQLEEILKRMLPGNLWSEKTSKKDSGKDEGDSMDTMDMYQLFSKDGAVDGTQSSSSSKPTSPFTQEAQKYFGSDEEKAHVEEFLKTHSGKSNLMIIVAKFTQFLALKWSQEWPEDLTKIYLETYKITRQHIPHAPMEDDTDGYILEADGEMTLLFCELSIDAWLLSRPDEAPPSTLDMLGVGVPSEELGYIIHHSTRSPELTESNAFFRCRVLWTKANIFLCQGDIDIVIDTLEYLLSFVEEVKKDLDLDVSLKLANCKNNSFINARMINKVLLSVQRGQKLGEIDKLNKENNYADLAMILHETFKYGKQANKYIATKVIMERSKQLAVLLNSLWQLGRYEDCYVWAEACFDESWHNYIHEYNTNMSETAKRRWATCVLDCLDKLNACTAQVGTFVINFLPENYRVRLVQNLINLTVHQTDVSDLDGELVVETVLPWILLHYILQNEEDKERSQSTRESRRNSSASESDDEDKEIPSPLMVLFIGHEFCGRRECCTVNDGQLLLFTMNLIVPQLKSPRFKPFKDKIGRHVEQIFYCLYDHPKRPKKQYVEDHGATRLSLSWESAQLLFEFYRPDEYPSPLGRAALFSQDTETLFKRIVRLLPTESDPTSLCDDLTAYLSGEKDAIPMVKKALPMHISSIFYLLGDNNFKNQVWLRAIKYYTMDLCSRPSVWEEFSWAALAMATGALTEDWLKNCREDINEEQFLTKAKVVQSCFERAIKFDPSCLTYWTEYGNYAYICHSFCSRLLKQESESMNFERFNRVDKRKEEMLDIAKRCFTSAIKISNATHTDDKGEDDWLYHYMLAKIAEKKSEDAPIFLDHYSLASKHLQENNAEYPLRINYKCPQKLSIEALEVHYRIHASILKYLERHDRRIKKSVGRVFQEHLKACSNGTFMAYAPAIKGKEYATMKQDSAPKVRDENSAVIQKRTDTVEEAKKVAVITKQPESKKRPCLEESQEVPSKRLKVSHLQVMQDVVALANDLINKVCNDVEASVEQTVVISSDEGEDVRMVEKKNEEKPKEACGEIVELPRADNIESMIETMLKQESKREVELIPVEDENKKVGNWLHNNDLNVPVSI